MRKPVEKKPSAAARLIAERAAARVTWRPAPGEQTECIDEIIKHNRTARSSMRIGAPRLAQLFRADFGCDVCASVMGRYLVVRKAELAQNQP